MDAKEAYLTSGSSPFVKMNMTATYHPGCPTDLPDFSWRAFSVAAGTCTGARQPGTQRLGFLAFPSAPLAPARASTCAGTCWSLWCSSDSVQSTFGASGCMQMASAPLQRVVMARDTIWTDEIRPGDILLDSGFNLSRQRPRGVLNSIFGDARKLELAAAGAPGWRVRAHLLLFVAGQDGGKLHAGLFEGECLAPLFNMSSSVPSLAGTVPERVASLTSSAVYTSSRVRRAARAAASYHAAAKLLISSSSLVCTWLCGAVNGGVAVLPTCVIHTVARARGGEGLTRGFTN